MLFDARGMAFFDVAIVGVAAFMENILEQTMAHELIIVKDSVYNMCDNIICFYSTIMAAVFLVVRPFFVLYNKTIGTN